MSGEVEVTESSNPKVTVVQILLTFLIMGGLLAASRFYEFDLPLWRALMGRNRVDPETLHLQGEFVENNLGTAREADGSYTLRMIAQQYMFVPHCVRIPAGTRVHVRLTSADGAHTLTITGLDYSVEAMPTSVTRATFQIAQPGVFQMPCKEFCGAGHYAMVARMEVVPAEQFQNVRPTDRVGCGAP
jgi:cytochrome c oxidase subunit II